jgi:glycosyltransferase involved in cell wall biosynthesis
MKLLRIVLDGEEYPHYTITKEFEQKFDYVNTIWWQTYNISSLNELLKNTVRSEKYDAVFMQIQNDHIISPETAKILSENSLVFNWTGDVRTNLIAYTRIAENIITLFTNTTNVEMLRDMGYKSDYLQVGYDHKYYYPHESVCNNNIVFCGNYYPVSDFPLTTYRVDMAKKLKSEFGDRFNLYGYGWRSASVNPSKDKVLNEEEAHIYRTCGIAINCSHFNYGRYFSDRLLREMSCGALVLTHNYKDYDMDFSNGKHFVVWNDFEDLVQKCRYYLVNREEAKLIAECGRKYVTENFQWSNFVDNFIQLIKKYKK